MGVSVALLLVFFAVFSSSRTRTPLPGLTARAPSLGRRVTSGQQQNDPARAVTPILSADTRQGDSGSSSQVTADEVGGTSPRYREASRLPATNGPIPEKPSAGREKNTGQFALKNVDFSDPAVAAAAPIPNPPRLPSGESDSDLKKPSIVFVRAAQSAAPALQSPHDENDSLGESPRRYKAGGAPRSSSKLRGARARDCRSRVQL